MRLAGTKLAANHQYRGFGDQLYDLSGQRPSLDLNFSGSKSLVDATTGQNLVTFTRASSGTYVDSQGVIRTATTNLLLRSEEFSSASWVGTRSSVVANVIAAPNGTITADKLRDDNASIGQGYIGQTFTSLGSTSYTCSFYAKADECTAVNFYFTDTSGITAGTSSSFNLLTGTASGANASIQEVGNGWYRCSVVGQPLTGTATVRILLPVDTATLDGIYLWGAQLEQSSTVGEYIPTTSTINSAPRFDHNPTTGESLGLLVEEQRTNSLRNNTMVGAVTGTPGTLPTNWVIAAAANLSTNVIRTGVSDGVTYIDLQIVGTSNATAYILAFEGNAQIVALQNQSWSQSLWVSRVAGSFTNISATSFNIRESNSSGSQVAANVIALAQPTVTLTRVSGTTTLSQATTAFITPGLRLTITNGAAIDITLRIGLPQLEQGAFATSVIPTTTAAVTRAADVASITGSNFSSWYRQDEGTIFVNATTNATHGGSNSFPRKLSISAGTTDNSIEQYYRVLSSYTDTGYRVDVAGVSQAQFDTNNQRNGQSSVIGYAANDYAFAVGGTVVNTDFSGTVPTTTLLRLGQRGDGSAALNGTIRRLTYFPTRLANETLQRITQ